MKNSRQLWVIAAAVLVFIVFRSPEPLDVAVPTGSIVAISALPDKTALLAWRGEHHSYLSRVRTDGSTIWMQALPGEIRNHALVVDGNDIAVPFQDGTAVVVALYSTGGELRWQRILQDLAGDRDAEAGAELATSIFIGDSLVLRYYVGEHPHLAALRRSDGHVAWDRPSGLEGGIVPLGTSGFVVQDVFETRAYDLRSGESHPVEDGCVVGDRLVTPRELGVESIRACGHYRDRDAWVVNTAAGTMLLEKRGDGTTVLQHPLPRVHRLQIYDFFGFSWKRAGFTGELPRFVPLVADEDPSSRAILVDLETGEIVGHSDADLNIKVFRDGDISFVLLGFVAEVAAFDPRTHTLGALQSDLAYLSVDPAQIAAGVLWKHSTDETLIVAPAIHPIALLK